MVSQQKSTISNNNNLIDILIVDDEKDIRELISDTLKDEGYTTRLAKDSDTAFISIAERVPTAIILDIWLKDSPLDGLSILETVKRKYQSVPVIMISGHGNIETAITSIKMGAYDYIEKPFKEDKLILIVKRAIEAAKLKKENSELKMRVAGEHILIGNSHIMNSLKSSVEKVAPTSSRVFITGPAGSGKEVIAHFIHERSSRKNGPFVILNPSSISPENLDVELFGTEDNAGINGGPRKIGIFEKVHGGTLFIDEVVDMPLSVQGKLLKILQDQCFERVGGNKKIATDFRVITSSNRDILTEIKSGKLREDLFYRLNVVPLRVPSLSERREDIPALARHFLKRAAEINGLPQRIIGDDSVAALQAYEWPGNVRQLKNIMEWVLIMAPGDSTSTIKSNMLPIEVFSSTPAAINPELNTDIMSMPLREARELFERQYLMAQVNRFGGNISRTSAFVGMERSALHRKLRSLNIGAEEKTDAV